MKICLITFTRNSEKGLKRLLENVYEIVDDIVIIDGFSTDNTLKIAKDYNARIYQRKSLGYPDPERLRAMKLCKYDWILHLDTDEIINENLKHDLMSLILKNLGRDIVAYKISRIAYYEHLNMPSYYSWPDWQIRIYNRRKVAFKGLIHEHIKVQGKYLYLPLKKYYIIHFHKLDLKKIIKYTYIHKKVYARPFNASRIRNFLTKYNPLMLLFLHFPIGLIKNIKK